MASKIQRELAFLLTGKDVSASKAMRGVRKEVTQLGNIAGKAGTNLTRNLERTVVVGAAAATGAIGYAVKAAMDFESATAGVAKTVDGDISAIVQGLKDLASNAPIAYEELAGIAEAGGALGVAKGDLLNFTDVVAKLGVTTDLTSDAAATALGHLTTTLRLTGDDYAHLGNALVDLGNNGSSTESQILGMAESIAGTAAIVGLSKQQVLGWGAALANTGEEIEAGGSSLQRFFLESFSMVNQGGDGLKAFAKVAGMSAKDFKAAFQKDASGALEGFLVNLGKLDEATQAKTLQDLGFTDIRITRSLLKLLANTDNLTDSLDLSDKAWAENNAMTKEAEKRFATSASQMKILENNVRLAAATIGAELLPQINELAKEGVDWIQNHQPEIKQFAKDLARGIRDAVEYAKSLDWDAIAAGLQGAAGAAQGILSAFMALPDWVKEVLVGGFVLNKATGGLATDLAGFFAKMAVQRMVVNAAVAQISAGSVAGGAGPNATAAGGIGTLGKVFLVGEAIALLALISSTNDEIAGNTRHQSAQLSSQVDRWLSENKLSSADLQAGLGATKDAIARIKSDPLALALNVDGARDALEGLERDQVKIEAKLQEQLQADKIAAAQQRIDESILRANTLAGFSSVVAAIRAIPAPTINVKVPVEIRPGVTSRTVTEAKYESDRYYVTSTQTGMKAI